VTADHYHSDTAAADEVQPDSGRLGCELCGFCKCNDAQSDRHTCCAFFPLHECEALRCYCFDATGTAEAQLAECGGAWPMTHQASAGSNFPDSCLW